MILSLIEQELWAEVYGAEYRRLAARVAAMVDKPDPNTSNDWRYGSAVAGNECAEMAAKRADLAVESFRLRSRPG